MGLEAPKGGVPADEGDVPAVGAVVGVPIYFVLRGFGEPAQSRSIPAHGPDPLPAPILGHAGEDDPPAVWRVLGRCDAVPLPGAHESARIGAVGANRPDRPAVLHEHDPTPVRRE